MVFKKAGLWADQLQRAQAVWGALPEQARKWIASLISGLLVGVGGWLVTRLSTMQPWQVYIVTIVCAFIGAAGVRAWWAAGHAQPPNRKHEGHKKAAPPRVLPKDVLHPDDEHPRIATEWAGGNTVTLLIVNSGADAVFEATARIAFAEFDHKRQDVFTLRWEQSPFTASYKIEHGRYGKLAIAEIELWQGQYIVKVFEWNQRVAASWRFPKARFFKFGLVVELHAEPPLRDLWVDRVSIDVDEQTGVFQVGFPIEKD